MSSRFDVAFTSRVVRSSAQNGTFEAEAGDHGASAPDAARPALRILSADGLNAINKWATSGDGERLIAESVNSACAHLTRTVTALDKALKRCDDKINALEARLLRQEEETEHNQATKEQHYGYETKESKAKQDAECDRKWYYPGAPPSRPIAPTASVLPMFSSPPRRSARARGVPPAMPPSPPRARAPTLGKRDANAFMGTMGLFDSPVRMTNARPPPGLSIRRPRALTGSERGFGLPGAAGLRTSEEDEDEEECGL